MATPKLAAAHRRINEAKHMIDELKTIPGEYEAFRRALWHSPLTNNFLSGKKGMLADRGFRNVTNAYLKMWEILVDYIPSMTRVRSLSVAEAPGAFLGAMMKFYELRGVDFDWVASSYRPEAGERFLGDDYGFISNYPWKWVWGEDGLGDITNFKNLKWFQKNVPDVNLFTSDAKDPDDDFDNEEVHEFPLLLGSAVGALLCLQPGGHAVLKTFSLTTWDSVRICYVLSRHFDKFYIAKPPSSRPTNSELYIVCLYKKKDVSDDDEYMLEQAMKNKKMPDMDVPQHFLEHMETIMGQIANLQYTSLANTIADSKMRRNTVVEKKAKMNEWIRKYI